MLILFLSISLKFSVHAHELWLEPINFNFNNKEIFKTNINIGQDFMGTSFGFYSPNKKNLYIENKNELINLSQRNGNFPAIQILVLGQGFHILNYETNNEFLRYDSIETFEDFIKEQGLQNIITKFNKNKIATENYRRFAKTLITDGNENFFIQKPKLDFELIALNSPYDLKNNIFKFQLFEKKLHWEIGKLLFLAKMRRIPIKKRLKQTLMEKEK